MTAQTVRHADSEGSGDSLGIAEILRVLRRHRWLVAGITVVAMTAACAYSLLQSPTYEAQASLAFADQSQDLSVLGNVAVRSQEPDQLAAASANTITRPELLEQVRSRLGLSLSVEALRKRFTARVEPTSNLVAISATAGNAKEAARLAGTLADTAVTTARGNARRKYRDAALGVERRLETAGQGNRDATTRVGLQDQLTRLQSLAALVDPATVVEGAQTPDSPASPKPLRNTILAGLLGLMLGVLAAYVRNVLDRRLRDLHEIQEHVGFPLLGHIRNESMGRVADVGTSSANGEGRNIEEFRIVHTNLLFLDTPGPTTAVVTSALPEEGKTTVAASLACASAATGKRTLLVECDLRRPVFAERLEIRSSPGLTDYLMGHATPQEVLQTVSVIDPSSGNGNSADDSSDDFAGRRLACVTAGSGTSHPAELLATERFDAFLKEVSRAYDLVVLDTCPLLPVADTLELVPRVDAVVLCVRADQTTRDQALAGKEALERFPKRPIGLVVTGLTPREEAQYGYYGPAYGY